MYLICETAFQKIGEAYTFEVGSLVTGEISIVTWTSIPAEGKKFVGINGITGEEAAIVGLDNRFAVVWSDFNLQEEITKYQARQVAAEAARTGAAIMHLASAETPDAIASRVVYRRIFTMLNDIREHLNLQRILEPEIVTNLIADAQNGQGSPISLG